MIDRTDAKSLTRACYEALRRDILACRLAPGERLKVNDLCQKLNVSLGAVREALSGLAAEGLVVAETQRGFRVASVSAADLEDLTRTRIEVEALCLRQALPRLDITWETAIVAAFHRLSRTPERVAGDEKLLSEEWAVAHSDFHAALVGACDSPWLLRLRALLYAQSERYRRLSVPAARRDRDLGAEHRSIMDAVLAGDADRAIRLMKEHLSFTAKLLEAVAEPQQDNKDPKPLEGRAEPLMRGRRARRTIAASAS
jgi:DNA-binding GntR family transcriptional regulator